MTGGRVNNWALDQERKKAQENKKRKEAEILAPLLLIPRPNLKKPISIPINVIKKRKTCLTGRRKSSEPLLRKNTAPKIKTRQQRPTKFVTSFLKLSKITNMVGFGSVRTVINVNIAIACPKAMS